MASQGKISFFSAVLMSINIMVGAGILYAVGPMTASAGSISFYGWPLIGLLLFPIIWSLAKASQLFPEDSGFYHYCSSGIGPTAGIVAHWGYLLGYMGTAASLATVLRTGLIDNAGFTLIKSYPIIFNLALVTFYTLINFIGIGKFSKIQSIATILKITPILMVVSLMAFYFNPNLIFDSSALSHMGMSVSTVIFAYWGFEACCSIGKFLKDGPHRVGRVILVGFFATMMLYSLFHLGLLYIMGPSNLAKQGAIAFPQYLALSPTLTGGLQLGILVAILFSWANSILGISLSNITNIHFLARKRLILGNELLTTVNSSQRPVYAAIAHGIALFAFLTFVTDIDILFALTNFGVIIAFVLTLAAVFRAQLQQRHFLQLAITLLAFVSCAILTYYSWLKISNPIYLLPLLIGLGAGVVMSYLQKVSGSPIAVPAPVPSSDRIET